MVRRRLPTPRRPAQAPRNRARPVRVRRGAPRRAGARSEEHTSELQSQSNLVCRLLLDTKKTVNPAATAATTAVAAAHGIPARRPSPPLPFTLTHAPSSTAGARTSTSALHPASAAVD